MHPFTKNSSESIAQLGERKLLENIRLWLGETSPPAPHGMGDDTAILPIEADQFNLITTDTLAYKCHFNDTVEPGQAGAKLVKRNLSDIAAMGGTPSSAVISLFLPSTLRLDWLSAFYAGVREESINSNIKIVGGDLCETEDFLGGQLTLWGNARRPVTRTGAESGDIIYVSGTLGGSSRGKHLDFTPRLAEGKWLAEQPGVHSMIDITDGLMKDLPDLIPPTCAAGLSIKSLPISEAAQTLSAEDDQSAAQHALNDGEDYELLFTLSNTCDSELFHKKWSERFEIPITRIGEMMEDLNQNRPRRIINLDTGHELEGLRGYEHFRAS